MKKLLRRAVQVYRTEGLIQTIEKSAAFVPRYVRHVLGTMGLYGHPCYRNLLIWWNSRPYSNIDPLTIVYVDPAEITHVTGRGPNPGRFKWQDIGTVQGGDWDRSDEQFEDLPVVRALRQRFQEGKAWAEIEFIQHVIAEAERGLVIWRGCISEADVRDACDRVDRLYRTIEEQGYLSKRELIEQNDVSPDKYVGGDGFERYDEVLVDIGRNGEFLFVDGRHRLAIAKILELDEIPVRISARHAEWQHRRKLYAERTDLDLIPDKHRDHPDVRDFLPAENESNDSHR